MGEQLYRIATIATESGLHTTVSDKMYSASDVEALLQAAPPSGHRLVKLEEGEAEPPCETCLAAKRKSSS